jgi:hypothetical protein
LLERYYLIWYKSESMYAKMYSIKLHKYIAY